MGFSNNQGSQYRHEIVGLVSERNPRNGPPFFETTKLVILQVPVLEVFKRATAEQSSWISGREAHLGRTAQWRLAIFQWRLAIFHIEHIYIRGSYYLLGAWGCLLNKGEGLPSVNIVNLRVLGFRNTGQIRASSDQVPLNSNFRWENSSMDLIPRFGIYLISPAL